MPESSEIGLAHMGIPTSLSKTVSLFRQTNANILGPQRRFKLYCKIFPRPSLIVTQRLIFSEQLSQFLKMTAYWK